MSIRDDFKPYIDGNNLLSPSPTNSSPGKASDNGVMYTSEYFIMLKKNGDLQNTDPADYSSRIAACIDLNGLLNRIPVGQSDGQEGPDDYYGVVNGCMEMDNTSIPRGFLR